MKKIILQKLKHLSKKCGLLFSLYLIMDINVFMITEILLFPLSVLAITDRNFMAILQLIYGNFLTQMSKFVFWVTGWLGTRHQIQAFQCIHFLVTILEFRFTCGRKKLC